MLIYVITFIVFVFLRSYLIGGSGSWSVVEYNSLVVVKLGGGQDMTMNTIMYSTKKRLFCIMMMCVSFNSYNLNTYYCCLLLLLFLFIFHILLLLFIMMFFFSFIIIIITFVLILHQAIVCTVTLHICMRDHKSTISGPTFDCQEQVIRQNGKLFGAKKQCR